MCIDQKKAEIRKSRFYGWYPKYVFSRVSTPFWGSGDPFLGPFSPYLIYENPNLGGKKGSGHGLVLPKRGKRGQKRSDQVR